MTYKHLHLREWPFRIVPEPEFCDFLADRTALRNEVVALLGSLENRPTSDIQLLWSWYGAGKTHTLFYIANQCAKKHQTLLPIYTELPREAKSFVDLYRVTISQIRVDHVIEAFFELTTRPAPTASFSRAMDPDLRSALTQAAVGERPVQGLFEQWLLGNPLSPSSHRTLGVGARVNTTEKCAVVLSDVVALLAPRGVGSSVNERAKRVVWIVDEVQRVEDLADSARRATLSGLVGVFNRSPTGLTIILSYTGKPREKSLPDWIPPDLKDRIGQERPMLLPDLRSDEALEFVRDVLAHFRLPGSTVDPYHPFEKSAIEALLKALGRNESALKPRSIMEALDASLRQLEPQFRSGTMSVIDTEALRGSLDRFTLDWSEDARRQRGKRA